MCGTFAGRVDRLDYKTIRYPGHRHLMRFMLQELGLGRQREEAMRLLGDAYPPVRDDVVIVYAAAEGNSGGRQAREEFVRVYRPRIVAGAARTAIAWTTAAGAVGMVELLAEGSLPDVGLRLPGGRVARRLPRHLGRPDAGARTATRRCATTSRSCQSLEHSGLTAYERTRGRIDLRLLQ